MDLLGIAARIAHPHPIDGIRALMQGNIKADDSLAEAVEKKRYNTFLSQGTIGRLQDIANAQLKLSAHEAPAGTAEQQLEALRSSGFEGLHKAGLTLQYVATLASQTRGKSAREDLHRLIVDFRGQAASGLKYWQSRLDQAKSDGNRTEIELAATWIGGRTLQSALADLDVSAETLQPQPTSPDTSNMSAAESFAKALEMTPLSDAHIQQLVSSFVNRHLLPDRPVDGTPYNVNELPDPYKRQRTPSLMAARADLRDATTLIEACPDDVAKSRLLPALSDLQTRVDAAEIAWEKLYAAYETMHAEEATPSRAEWMARARIYIEAGAPAPSLVSAAVMKLMAQPAVSDAEVAMVRNLFAHATGIPAGEMRRLDDFTLPDANALFRSLPEIMDELFDLRGALLDVEDETVQERLSDLLDSLTTTTQEANHFMLEESQRLMEGTRGFTVNGDAIELTWKWIERPYPQDQGDDAPTHPGMPKAGEGADVVDGANEGRRRTSQASHLFDQPEPDEKRAKPKFSALDAASRGSARIMAMR